MCRICEMNSQVEELPLRERLYLTDGWRVSHAWSSLPGWLVVHLRRHATSLDDLTAEEAASLGSLLRATSVALKTAVGCDRTYVMLFAEKAGYSHVHFHVVPRMAWFAEEDRSVGVFRFLNIPEREQVSVDERERLSAEIGEAIATLVA